MSTPIIQNSFAAGEVTPKLWGRTDLTKYRIGAAVLRNFFVDYRGGAVSRPGTQIVGVMKDFGLNPRNIPFQFNTDQSYVLELNGSKMRVIRDGGYITEAPKAIVSATPGPAILHIEIPASGWSVGDYIFISGVNGLVRPNGISGVNGRVFAVASVVGDDVGLVDPLPFFTISSTSWSAYVSGGTAARIYEIDTPWAASDLFELQYTQSADVMTVTHPDYVPYDIQRLAEANWTITPEVFGSALDAPAIVVGNDVNDTAGDPRYRYIYAVTAYNTVTKEESVISTSSTFTMKIQDQNEGRVAKIRWTSVEGANLYRIYKAQPVPQGQEFTPPYFWGLIGQTASLLFYDLNYEPDYLQVPPNARNPFGSGALSSIIINDPGIGYLEPAATITDSTGPGTGASATVQPRTTGVSGSTFGEVLSAPLNNAGINYETPLVTIYDNNTTAGTGLTLAFSGVWVAAGTGFNPGPGSITVATGGTNYHIPEAVGTVSAPTGDALVLTLSVTNGVVISVSWNAPANGVSSSNASTIGFVYSDSPANGALATAQIGGNKNPACICYFQQRKWFAASDDNPDTFWATRPGLYYNFDTSYPSQANDAITGTIVGQEVNAITSLTPMQWGIIAMTANGAYQISGGQQGAAISPTTIQAQPQAFSGAQQNLPPLRIDTDLLFAQARGSAVRNLAYNFYLNSYAGEDVSVFSAHLLENRRITQWAWAQEPDKIVWAVRDDGILLSLTYLKEQQVFGWARHDTAGRFISVAVIPEGREDAVYVVVRRTLPSGNKYWSQERLADRNFGGNRAKNIPSNPEAAWCVDAGAQYPMPAPGASLDMIADAFPPRSIYQAIVIDGGSGYPLDPVVVIEDDTGSSGAISLTVVGGVITAATVTNPGHGYTNPTIKLGGGTGGDIAVRIVDRQLFRASSPFFGSGDVGKVVRVGGGKGVILEVPTATDIVVDMSHPVLDLVADLPEPVMATQLPGTWTMTMPTQVVGGLDHLSGAYVSVLADGSPLLPRLVEDGCITLDQPASAIIAGEGYSCQLQTLRLTADTQNPIDSRRKNINAVTVRTFDTKGLKIGPDFKNMTNVKERKNELYGNPVPFQSGGGFAPEPFENAPRSYLPIGYEDHRTIIAGRWQEAGFVCLQQSWPLPAAILDVIPEVSVGDQPS